MKTSAAPQSCPFGRKLFRFLFLFALTALPAAAQTIPHVTGTFKTPGNLTPAQAGLRTLATINSVAVYGSVDFVPTDTAANRATRLLYGGITYPPQPVRAWIKSDGTLVDDYTAAAGVDLVPTVGATPTGLAMCATIHLAASSDGFTPASPAWTECKELPASASVDWGTLPVATITTPAQSYQLTSGGIVSTYESWTAVADSTITNPASGFSKVWFSLDSLVLKCKTSTGGDCNPAGSGGAPAFSVITSGTNTIATMVVGSGGSLSFSGTGVLNASKINGTKFNNAESLGKIPVGQGDGTATWSDPLVQGVYAPGTNVNTGGISGGAINPVLVGGSDYAGSPLLRNMKVDASGQIYLGNASLAVTGTFWQATQPVSGTFWQATQPVSIASLPALPANQSVNVAQINGITPLMGAGNTGTGSPRVTIASDQAAIPVSQSGTWNIATVTTLTGITNQVDTNLKQVGGGNTATVATGVQKVGIADSGGNAFLSAANALNSTGTGIQAAQLVGQFDDVAPTAITENQFGNLRLSANRNLYNTIRDAAGNERGANVNASSQLSVSIDNTPSINCNNCTGSGASAADAATFTPSSSSYAPGGCFFQTTTTNNALTNLQGGWLQCTANRELYVAYRSTPTVNAAQSGSWSLAANQSVNVAQINGITPLMGAGNTGTGSPRVTIASDQAAIPVNATLSAETTKVIGTVNQGTSPWVNNISQINGVTPLMGNGLTGTGSQRVTIASDNTAFSVNAIQSGSWSLAANQSVNVAQINGITPLMGAGNTGTGSPRVTIASDQAAIPVNATLSAETTKVIGTVNQGGAPWSDNLTQSAGVNFSGQVAGSLPVTIVSGAGSGGTASADNATYTGGVTNLTPMGALYSANGQAPLIASGSVGAPMMNGSRQLLVHDPANDVMLGFFQAQNKILASPLKLGVGSFNLPVSAANPLPVAMAPPPDGCYQNKGNQPISQTAATRLVPGLSGMRILVCFVNIVAGAAEIPSFIEGTGAACATGSSAVTGSTTTANGESYAANGGRNGGMGLGTVAATKVPGDDLCLTQNGSNRIAGNITYVYTTP